MRFLWLLALLIFPLPAHAVETPQPQMPVTGMMVLRGQFTEERQAKGVEEPVRSSGHFVIVPGQGLLWALEKPFPTVTIVTPTTMTQDLGGLAIKLPVKNVHDLYVMVSAALAGNWSALENDFVIKRGGDNRHWQMILTARPESSHPVPYRTLTISGSRFIENLVMIKADGRFHRLTFTNASLLNPVLNADETAFFQEARP